MFTTSNPIGASLVWPGMLMLIASLLLIAAPAWLCRRRALDRNYAGWPYLLAGACLSWGGLIITLLATREPRRDELWTERLARHGVVLELTDCELSRFEAEAAPDDPIGGYLALARENGRVPEFCRALQEVRQRPRDNSGPYVLWSLVTLGCGLCLLIFLWAAIVPAFIQLFEGMSLLPPLPTRTLCAACRLTREVGPGPICLGIGLLLAAGYVLLKRPELDSRRRALFHLKLAHAAHPQGVVPFHPDLWQDQMELIVAAAAQGRLGQALELLLAEQREPSYPWGLLAAAFTAFMSGLTGWTVLGLTLPFYQLVGNLG